MMALEGIKVLDLSRRYPGAISAMILGDFGADVIKVDAPAPQGFIGVTASDEEFAAHLSADRNKKSVTIDLRSEKGQAQLYKLVEKSDAIIESFRPGVMKRLKADYDTLKKINPRLVYCELTGFGQNGPYAGFPGHDPNYIAIAGILSLVGPHNGRPYLPSNICSDMVIGLYGAIGILVAIQARERTGRGQFVDISYLGSSVSMLHYDASLYDLNKRVPKRGETHLSGDCPAIQVLKCKDGEYFTIGCAPEPHLWANLCKALGREDLIPYQYPTDPKKKREVIRELRKIFLTRTRDEWFAYLKDKDAAIGPVNYINETFEDPQVKNLDMVVEMEHPKYGKIKQVGIPIKLSETPGKIRTLGVAVGSDNEEILRKL